MKKEELIGKYFPVLDHGFVALIDAMGDDAAVVQAARCSYGAGTKKTSEDRGLVRYLRRKRHTSPFEQVELKFHVKLPIFAARQLVRHRTASLNEYSLRYSLAPLQFYVPEFEVFRKQSSSNKQGRGEQAERKFYELMKKRWERARADAGEEYVFALVEDLARELARIDLPLSLYTEWYWKIDLHNLFHFLSLRADPHAQWEVQEYARVKAGIVKLLCPVSFEAWIDYEFAAATFSRMERLVLSDLIADAQRVFNSFDEVCSSYGMSEREAGELRDKLSKADAEPPSFDLDLASAKTAEYFAERAALAVPDIEAAKERLLELTKATLEP